VRKATAVFAISLLAAAVATAQMGQSPLAAPQAMPTPSPQQQAMGYFGGAWKVTGTTKITPTSPAVQFTSTQQGDWVPGNFFMEVKSVTHGPLGDVHTVRMMEYNSAESAYTYNEYNSLGEHVVGVGKIEGQKWVWNTVKKLNGVTTKGRYITTFVTANAYSIKSEVQKPGGGWLAITEGVATRTPAQAQ
jgi:hypothetical protein